MIFIVNFCSLPVFPLSPGVSLCALWMPGSARHWGQRGHSWLRSPKPEPQFPALPAPGPLHPEIHHFVLAHIGMWILQCLLKRMLMTRHIRHLCHRFVSQHHVLLIVYKNIFIIKFLSSSNGDDDIYEDIAVYMHLVYFIPSVTQSLESFYCGELPGMFSLFLMSGVVFFPLDGCMILEWKYQIMSISFLFFFFCCY